MNNPSQQPLLVPEKPIKRCPECGERFEYVFNEATFDTARNYAVNSRVDDLVNAMARQAWEIQRHEECENLQNERTRKEQEESERRRYEYKLTELRQKIDFFRKSPCFPSDMQNKTFDTFVASDENKKSFDLLRAWAGDNFGFLLMGPSGSGKTHLMISLVNVVLEHLDPDRVHSVGSTLLFINTSEFLELTRRDIETGKEFERIRKLTFLFLDDLGVENLTDWSRDQLYRLFEYRNNNKLATFITTNLSPSELKERMHERILSRILEMCVPVQLTGSDKRKDLMKDNLKVLNERIKQRDEWEKS